MELNDKILHNCIILFMFRITCVLCHHSTSPVFRDSTPNRRSLVSIQSQNRRIIFQNQWLFRIPNVRNSLIRVTKLYFRGKCLKSVLDHQNKGMSKEATIANRPWLSSASRKNKGWMTTFVSKRGALKGEQSAVHAVRNRKRIPLVVGIL
jgi:hypothetical protein